MAPQTVLQLLQQNAEKELLCDEADQVVNFHLAWLRLQLHFFKSDCFDQILIICYLLQLEPSQRFSSYNKWVL